MTKYKCKECDADLNDSQIHCGSCGVELQPLSDAFNFDSLRGRAERMDIRKVKPGMVIGDRGRAFIVLSEPAYNSKIRGEGVLVAQVKHAAKMIRQHSNKGLPGTAIMTMGTYRDGTTDIIKGKKLKGKELALLQEIAGTAVTDYKKAQESRKNKAAAAVSGRELTLENGKTAKAGDIVVVRFSNGDKDMILGNSSGKLLTPDGDLMVQNPRKRKARRVRMDLIIDVK